MRLTILLFSFAFFFHVRLVTGQEGFYAYHTKKVHSSTDYFGKFADLIVVLGDKGQLEFTRRGQYLPQWKTRKGAYSIDDFYPGRDPDYQFLYNYVRLIEQNADRIVVHWRYIPDIDKLEKSNTALNPTDPDGFRSVVHEFFTIYPSGKIERQVLDARGSRYESWCHSNYRDRQDIQLRADGITHSSVAWGNRTARIEQMVTSSPIVNQANLPRPKLWWSFDEGGQIYPSEMEENVRTNLEWDPFALQAKTIEAIDANFHDILGFASLYKQGVSGTSLGFDGYYTGIQMPKLVQQAGTTYFEEKDGQLFKKAITIEAWLALDVYPYNEAPIAHLSKDFGAQGFYFGINARGNLLFRVNGQTVTSEQVIPLYQWSHVACTFGNGKIDIYVDGQLIGSEPADGDISLMDGHLMLGLNNQSERCTDYVRSTKQNIPFIYGIQGLMDEVKMYDIKLTSEELSQNYSALLPLDRSSALQKAILPDEVGVADKFGATYKTLKHHELWDQMWRVTEQSDIVVKFEDNPASVIYWRGANYAASWVTDNNRWMADQSSEIFTEYGCSEHMADKQTRHSYARIIENNDARVMIHWRYPCVDVGYLCTDRRNWTDEYHTIYPDGSAVRKVQFNNANAPGFQDIQFFTNPGEKALDVVHLNAMTVANLEGEKLELLWNKPNLNPDQTLENATIEWINSKSEWKVYTIFQVPGISTWGRNEQSSYTDDPFAGPWNHWPTSLVPSDGRYAIGHDRVTHFALGANDFANQQGAMVHYGFTDGTIDLVIPKARFWQNPPSIVNLEGAENKGFKKEEKAYVLSGNGGDQITLRILATETSPLINPAFRIQNPNLKALNLKVNSQVLVEGKDFKVGVSHDELGKIFTIVWIKIEAEEPVEIGMHF